MAKFWTKYPIERSFQSWVLFRESDNDLLKFDFRGKKSRFAGFNFEQLITARPAQAPQVHDALGYSIFFFSLSRSAKYGICYYITIEYDAKRDSGQRRQRASFF